MAKPRKSSKATEAKVKRDIAKIMAATRPARPPGEISAGEQYRRSQSSTAKQERIDKDLPWRHSYANWCMHLGVAAAKYNARIDYGTDTYDAWEEGISPDTFARDRGRK